MVIASFDLIPTEPIYEYLLAVEELGALTDNFEAVGFESHFFLQNLGSLGIFISLFPILTIIMLLLKCCKDSPKA